MSSLVIISGPHDPLFPFELLLSQLPTAIFLVCSLEFRGGLYTCWPSPSHFLRLGLQMFGTPDVWDLNSVSAMLVSPGDVASRIQ